MGKWNSIRKVGAIMDRQGAGIMGKTVGSFACSCGIRFLICLILVPLGRNPFIGSEINSPVKPSIPAVESPSIKFSDTNNHVSAGPKVEISVHGSGRINGILVKPGFNETVRVRDNRQAYLSLRFRDIYEIRIVKWQGSEEKRGSFLFKPVEYIITLKNGNSFTADGNIEAFNQITISIDNSERFFFSVFYDYFKAGNWQNRRNAGPEPESRSPLNGAVTVIRVTG